MPDFTQRIAHIRSKAEILLERYKVVDDERRQALEKVAELETEVAKQHTLIEQLRQQVEYLQLAATITPDRDQLEHTRQVVSNIIREIDRCINELAD